MYNPETIAQAEGQLRELLWEAQIAENSGYPVPRESLDYLIRWAYERTQASKRGMAVDQQALVDRIHELDQQRDGLIGQLIELIKPTPDEIEEVYMQYREDGKDSAEYLTELMMPLVVLDTRQVIAEDEEADKLAQEALNQNKEHDSGSHN